MLLLLLLLVLLTYYTIGLEKQMHPESHQSVESTVGSTQDDVELPELAGSVSPTNTLHINTTPNTQMEKC